MQPNQHQTETTSQAKISTRIRVKMKPPWPPRSRRRHVMVDQTRSHKWQIVQTLSLLLMIVNPIGCDKSRWSSSSSSSDEDSKIEDQTTVERSAMMGAPFDGPPRFAPSEAKDLIVIASSWQNEVYLPCKIINLDEDQTVGLRRQP